MLDRTTTDHELRAAIREHARGQDGYDARLYDLWEQWNAEFFEGLLVPPLVQLAEPGQTRCYGDCSNYSGLAGIRSRIRLRPSILEGTLRDLRHGSRNREGLQRFLEDVLLHEMIHQYHQEITGEHYDSWSGHGPAFSAKANEIGQKLGLAKVRRTCKSRDGKEPSPSQWPHDVRPDGYYLGAHAAHVLSTKDEDEALRTAVGRMLDKHGVEKVIRVTRELSEAQAATRVPPSVDGGQSVVDEDTIRRIHIPTARKSGEPYEEPAVFYIGGRYNRGRYNSGPYNFAESALHNPYNKSFRRGEISREQSVALFREYMLKSERLLHKLAEFDEGTIFGCWCRLDELCHGDVLIELWKAIRFGTFLALPHPDSACMM